MSAQIYTYLVAKLKKDFSALPGIFSAPTGGRAYCAPRSPAVRKIRYGEFSLLKSVFQNKKSGYGIDLNKNIILPSSKPWTVPLIVSSSMQNCRSNSFWCSEIYLETEIFNFVKSLILR